MQKRAVRLFTEGIRLSKLAFDIKWTPGNTDLAKELNARKSAALGDSRKAFYRALEELDLIAAFSGATASRDRFALYNKVVIRKESFIKK